MRNQIARVVLAAGLGVASAFAQAPASSIATSSTDPFAGIGRQVGTSLGSAPTDPNDDARDRIDVPAFGARTWQDDGRADYSVSTLFREAHGEFMDRRERYDPSLELRARWMPNQRINGEPGSFDLFGYDFDVEFPVVIYPDSYLLFGLYQYGRHYSTTTPFGSANNPGINSEGNWGDQTLTAAGARLGFGVFVADNVLFEMETNPGVYSDLDGTLTHKDYDFPSSAMVTIQATDNFFWKLGARYNQVYEDAPWLPWLGFSWEVVEGVRIDLMAPEYVELSWWPSGSTAIALGAQVQGAQYRVRSSSGTGKQRANLQIQEVIVYAGLTQRFTDHFSLNVRGGAVVAGDYFLTTGAASFDPAEGALDQGFYADVTFGIDW
jgi:hypothetical protein